MLRKRKPAVPERQAPPPSSSAFAEQMRALAERARWRDELKHADLTKLCEELKRSPQPGQISPAARALEDPNKLRKWAAHLRQLLQQPEPSEPTSAKPKKTRPRLGIKHLDGAIDQMLAERKADPVKLRLVKTQRERVVEILKKQHRQTLPKSQNRTLERRIAERRDKPGR